MENNVLIVENNLYPNKELMGIVESHKTIKKLCIARTYVDSCHLISSEQFNVIIFNILMSSDKICNLIKLAKVSNKNVKILLINNNSPLQTLYNFYDIGVNICLIRPFSKLTFIAGLNSILYTDYDKIAINHILNIKDDISPENHLRKILFSLGISEDMKSYNLIKDAIIYAQNDANCLNNQITSKLYPILAEKYNTTTSIVEHTIRDCINKVWKRSKLNGVNEKLDIKFFSNLQRPSNAEFISLLAEKLN